VAAADCWDSNLAVKIPGWAIAAKIWIRAETVRQARI